MPHKLDGAWGAGSAAADHDTVPRDQLWCNWCNRVTLYFWSIFVCPLLSCLLRCSMPTLDGFWETWGGAQDKLPTEIMESWWVGDGDSLSGDSAAAFES